jgi:hypothetical protein
MHDTHRAISEKQLAANRANAAKSTGPRTATGRARSAQNALKHGFAAQSYCLIRGENPESLANLRADLVHTYCPVNHAELLAVERIAFAQWSIERCYQLEAGMFTSFFNKSLSENGADFLHPQITDDYDPAPSQNMAFVLADGLHRQSKHKSFSLFLRYKSQVERDYRRAVEEWERVRKLRDELAEFPNEPISASESPIPDPESTQDSPNEPISTSDSPNPEIESEPRPLGSDPQIQTLLPGSESCGEAAQSQPPGLPAPGAVWPIPSPLERL